MTRFFVLACLFFPVLSFGQYHFYPKNHTQENRFNAKFYSVDTSYHTSVNLINNYSLNLNRQEEASSLKLDKYNRWFGRKLLNKSLLKIEGENYSFRLDPLVNLSIGTEQESEGLKYLNSRGFFIQGKLGNNVSFSSSFSETQAIFANYVSDFIGNFEVVPGSGFSRKFGEKGHDFSMASGEVSYQPNDIFVFTAGQGRNFFGEGYRSMLLSDASFNYPFFRIQTSFGKIKYVNLWGQLYDVRSEVIPVKNVFLKKHFSSHYLSVDITNRWNLSFFEAIILSDTAQQRGLDVSFLNPIIFYRPVEFAVGSRLGNALLGASSSYIIKDGLQVYSQFVLDEFTGREFFASDGYWGNKFGFQLGIKSFNTFNIKGLFARAEFNTAKPYTYSHNESLGNYGHYSQSLAHPWGANFNEFLVHLQYNIERWEFELQYNLGLIGLDTGSSNWGANIYLPYTTREQDYDNFTGQGIEVNLHFLQLRMAWIVNAESNLKVELGYRRRHLSSSSQLTLPLASQESNFVFFGLRTEMFNQYYDF